MKKLLVISSVFPPFPAGEADYAINLCKKLKEKGWKVEILTTKGVSKEELGELKIWPIIKNWSWFSLIKIYFHLKKNKPDAIMFLYIGWIYHFHPAVTQLAFISKKFFPNVPFVVLFYSSLGAELLTNKIHTRTIQKIFNLLISRKLCCYEFGSLLLESDKLIYFCEEHGKKLHYAAPYAKDKLILIPPPPLITVVSKNSYKEETKNCYDLNDNSKIILFFGHIYPAKRIDILFEAFKRIRAEDTTTILFVVGSAIKGEEDYYNFIKNYANELGISNFIRWVGPYDWKSEEPSRIFWISNLCVLPFSVGVALNNSTVSAACAHGMPIITTRGKEIEAAFVDRKNVYLYDANNADELYNAIKCVLYDDNLRKTLSEGAQKLYEDYFSWDNTINKIEECFL